MQNVRLQQLDCIITITLFHRKLSVSAAQSSNHRSEANEKDG